jgi:hypothetical protein
MDCRPRASCYLRCMRILNVLTFLTVILMGCQTGDRPYHGGLTAKPPSPFPK